MSAERIVSLVPAATEILFDLGAGDKVQAVSHECNHPPAARDLPQATRTRMDPDGSSREIDDAVRAAVESGEPMYEVLGDVLHHAQPNLVITQEACDVCGITPVDVKAQLARIEPADQPEIHACHPHTLEDVLGDVQRLAEAAGVPEAGRERVRELEDRVRAVEGLADQVNERPRVAVLDWLDPPMAAGHWIPPMVEQAGGTPTLVTDTSPSTYVDLDEIREADPGVLVLAPCGFDVERTLEELGPLRDTAVWSELEAVRSGQVYAVNADAYTSRPGPRLVDGLEQLACCLLGEPARERYPDQAERVHRLT